MPIQADASKIIQQFVGEKPNMDKATSRWWLKEDLKEVHSDIYDVAMRMYHNLSGRRRQNYQYSLMYSDFDFSLYVGQMSNAIHSFNRSGGESYQMNRITVNVVQNCIDAAAALISKNKPKPQFLTNGAKDYALKQRAKKLTKYIGGVFDDTDLYTIAQKVFTDACIYGTGALKIIPHKDKGKIQVEWVFIENVLVDDMDAFYGKPEQMHCRQFISRDKLVHDFPDYADEIMSVNSSLSGEISHRTIADLVPVIESWHLPTKKGAKDGMHCISLENCTLLAEPYERDYFPIFFFRWYDNPYGMWGRGVSQEISKIQREINKISRTIQQAQELVAVPVVFVENASMVAEDHIISNDIGRVVEYSGTKPTIETPPAVQPELYQYQQFLIDLAYKIVGVSQASATATNPLGPSASGAAFRELADVVSGRFEVIGQRWENFFMDMAKVMVDMSKELYHTNKDLSLNVKTKKFMETIKWEDVDMDLDQFAIQVFPISGLPNTPAGRIQAISEYAANGWIPKEFAMSLLDFPDLEDFVSMEISTTELVQEILSLMKDEGKYTPPIPQMDLNLAFKIATLEVVRSQQQHVPEENIDLIRRFLNDCQDLLNQAQQPVQAQVHYTERLQPGQAPPDQAQEMASVPPQGQPGQQ